MHHLSPGAASALLLLALATGPASAADAEHGKALYQSCAACHSERPDALNPMKRANLVWDEANLRDYIKDPQAKVKGNRMPYGGLIDAKDVDDIIAYLKTLN